LRNHDQHGPTTLKAALNELPHLLRRLIVFDLISGILLVVPLLRPQSSTPALGLLAVVLFLPYLVVCWRVAVTPETKDGPGLAVGIGTLFTFAAALGCAVAVEQRDYLHLAYFGALGLTHGLMAGLGFAAFRQGTSKRPVWRVVLRSVVDPIVYYGIVLVLALGALAHHFAVR
jgi:hypothetical protein